MVSDTLGLRIDMALEFKQNKWIIVSKDRKIIAKGIPRNRYLIPVKDTKDKKRILYYDSQKKAEAGFCSSWFFTNQISEKYEPQDMEAVEVEITFKEIIPKINPNCKLRKQVTNFYICISDKKECNGNNCLSKFERYNKKNGTKLKYTIRL